ncbi:MAG: hypothetical protein N3F04_05740 [Candidatus Nezhaarchaeota archaeon]|nr:hypothetical protein [Candidatus Nezhaarchaeota archaeon]MCX8142244.1 hypothetical protein [Candidatus Nezhaarchaeota archaeon]MDW8050783.1 hypothetical protein [Nitrososphaerota archaeon]
MSKLHVLIGIVVLILGTLGILGSLYLFGLKAVTTSLVRDMIGSTIWCVGAQIMTAYEGINVMNEWLNELSLLSDKLLLLLSIYSLILTLTSIAMIRTCNMK